MFLLDGMPFKLEYLKRVLDRLRRSECDFEKRRSSQVDYGSASVSRATIDRHRSARWKRQVEVRPYRRRESYYRKSPEHALTIRCRRSRIAAGGGSG